MESFLLQFVWGHYHIFTGLLKPKQGFQLILLNWGGDVGVFLWVGVCEGVGIYVYMVGVC